MQKQLKALAHFQSAFNLPEGTSPRTLPYDQARLRYNLMKEENEEYLGAVAADNLVEIADALTDKLYILCGTIVSHGMQHIIENCFDEVHRSNMSKLDADGKPIINGINGVIDYDNPIGKVLKSANYSKPNLKQFLCQ